MKTKKMPGRDSGCIVSRRDGTVYIFFPRRDGTVNIFSLGGKGRYIMFSLGGTGRQFPFSSAGRDGKHFPLSLLNGIVNIFFFFPAERSARLYVKTLPALLVPRRELSRRRRLSYRPAA